MPGIARDEGVREAQPVRFGEPALDARDPSDLAREAHFADRDEVLGERGVARGGGEGERDREVRGGLGELHAADRRGVDVPLPQGADPAALLQDGEHHRDAGGLQTGGRTPGGGDLRVDGERLHLGDQGAAALQGDGQTGAGDGLGAAGQEQARWGRRGP